jgi:hypothetical protein
MKFTHLLASAALAAFPLIASAQFTLLEEGGTFRNDAVNLATGATVMATSELGLGVHFAININNGTYGNGSSWIGGSEGSVDTIGYGFAAPSTIETFAFGRDNTNTLTDRSSGAYFFEYSLDYVSGAAITTGTWTTIGLIDYAPGSLQRPSFPYLRHLYSFGGPISNVTGFRVTTQAGLGGGQAIDELEVYTSAIPEPSTYAALAGVAVLGLAAFSRRRRA